MTIAFVQSNSGHTTGAQASATATWPTPTTAGNLLVALVSSSVTTTFTNAQSWTGLTFIGDATTLTKGIQLWWKSAAGSDADPTFSFSSGTASMCVAIAEYSGVAAAVDVENAQAVASGSPYTTPTVTPVAGREELLVFGCTDRTAGTWSAENVNSSSTGVNERVDDHITSGSSVSHTLSDSIIASTTGTYNADATASSATVGATAIAMFKAGVPSLVYVGQAIQRASLW